MFFNFKPYLVYIPFVLTKFIIEIVNIFTFYKFNKKNFIKTKLLIEAGKGGWEILEYKELLHSANEFLGKDNVNKIIINRDISYIYQVLRFINTYKPTHYLYDPRTIGEDQFWVTGIFQTIILSIIFQIKGVIPICSLVNFSQRVWRTKASIITAKRGLVISLMSPKQISKIFPHKRIVGPLPMPLSENTLNEIENLVNYKNIKKQKFDVSFVGSLYEPRKTFFLELKTILKNKNIIINFKTTAMGGKKLNDLDYWDNMVSSKIIITTSSQVIEPVTDWTHINHMIYRYLEVTACNSLLMANYTNGIENYFIPEIDYVVFNDAKEAADKIEYFINNEDKRKLIAFNGNLKAKSIIKSKLYWITINIGLYDYPLI